MKNPVAMYMKDESGANYKAHLSVIIAVAIAFIILVSGALFTTVLYIQSKDIVSNIMKYQGGASGGYDNFLGSLPLFILIICATVLVILGALFYTVVKTILTTYALKDALSHQKEKAISIEQNADIATVISKNVVHDRKNLLNAIGGVVCELDKNGQVIEYNEALKDWLSSKNKKINGLSFVNFFYDKDRDLLATKINAIDKLKSYHTSARFSMSDGHFKTVDVTLCLLYVSQSKSYHIIATLIDIDQHAQTLKALKNAEINYRLMVENTGFGFFQLYPDGVFKTAHPTLAKILDYEGSDELMDNVLNVFNDLYYDDEDAKSVMEELSISGLVMNYECRVLNKSKQPVWVSLILRAIMDQNGDLQYYEGSLENIHQRKIAEMKLQDEKNKAELANRSKSEFLSNMSHELRTPLNSIIGFSKIIEDMKDSDINANSYKDYAADIHKSGQHLLKIINEILDIARIDINKQQLSEKEINVVDAIESVIGLHRVKLNNKGLTLDLDYAFKGLVIADEMAFKRIVMNVLSNAIKFTDEGGAITIETGLTGQNEVKISITDTGGGLSESQVKKALSPFTKTTHVGEDYNDGTGLGLTLTKALMELHKGKIDMISQRGIGTTVIITFPENRTVQN
jgi:PAS domain S-box-containing protein